MTATDVLTVDDAAPAEARARAGDILRGGELLVAPTDTVYAVYADASQPAATARLFDARGAGRDAPLSVLIHNPRHVPALAEEVSEAAERLMASYWPGPLTLIFRAAESLDWDLGETDGSVALRMPAEPIALQVISAVGPCACSAAAPAGAPPPTTVEQARAGLGDGAALYLDGGTRKALVSTVVDVSRGGAEVLREGAIPAEHIAQVASGEVGWGEVPDIVLDN